MYVMDYVHCELHFIFLMVMCVGHCTVYITCVLQTLHTLYCMLYSVLYTLFCSVNIALIVLCILHYVESFTLHNI